MPNFGIVVFTELRFCHRLSAALQKKEKEF